MESGVIQWRGNNKQKRDCGHRKHWNVTFTTYLHTHRGLACYLSIGLITVTIAFFYRTISSLKKMLK